MLDSVDMIDVRAAAVNLEDFKAITDVLLEGFHEIKYMPVNKEKTAAKIYQVMNSGMAYLAFDEDGSPVGTLGMIELDYWYSDVHFLQSLWFYVLPRYRNAGHGKALLRMAAQAANEKGLLGFVEVDNPQRRTKAYPGVVEAVSVGFIPFGYRVRIT